MRILTLCYEYPPLGGGGAKVVHGLACHLSKRGHSIDIVTMGHEDLSPYERTDDVRVFRVSGIRRRTDRSHTLEMLPHEFQALRKGRELIGTNSYDIVHCHFIFPDGIVGQHLARFAGVPLLTTIHGSDIPGYNPDRFQIQHKLLYPVWRFTVSRTNLIASPSEHLKTLLLRSAPNARCTVIPNGFEPGRFDPSRPKEDKILVCTRMFKRKGVQYVLEALARANSQIPIHIVGDGPHLPELKALAKRLGVNSMFWGWVDNDSKELRDLYETSKIFAFTSDQENFPINLLEAMSAGNAIVTTDSSGTREVVGNTAVLVPPRDPQAIAGAFAELANDEVARDYASRARTRLVENFSWEAVASRYEDTMFELIGSRLKNQES